MANKILVARGTKARIESIKSSLSTNELVYSTDTGELGIKKADGNIQYFMNAEDVNALVDALENSKVDKLVDDLNALAYFNYAGRIYGDKYSLLASAWEHSLTVDPLEISEDSSSLNPRGRAQYPNGETEGVIIPQGVTRIGNYAFSYWSVNNQPLVIPNSVTSIESYAFSYWSANNHPLVIPSSVTSIGNYAFYDWESNNHPLVIPSSVESIGYGAFRNWESNNHPLVIPSSVTSIGNYAFYDWESNNHPLVIPSSVESIGSYAFRYWGLVPYIEIQRIIPPTLASANAFEGQNDAPIYVPDESVEAYKTATNWVDLADRIFSINDKE